MSIRKDNPLGDVRYVANTDDGILLATGRMAFLLCGPTLEEPVPTIRDIASGKTMRLKGFEAGDFEAFADLRSTVIGRRSAHGRPAVRRSMLVLGVILVIATSFILGRSVPERIPGLDLLTYEAAETSPAPNLDELEAFLRYLAENSPPTADEADVPVGGSDEAAPAAREEATDLEPPAAGEIFVTPEFLLPAPDAESSAEPTSIETDEVVRIPSMAPSEPSTREADPQPAPANEAPPPEAEQTPEALQRTSAVPEITGEADLARILAEGEAIPAEMLIDVPHEVASVLRRAGAVSDDAPDGVPYSIIRLSPQTMERYTGRDGIPTIPHSNSWVATGNSVSLPLPGGGDIKSEEDFAAFGLKP